MRARWLAMTILLTTTLSLSACTSIQRFTDKPWGRGTYIPAAICAVAGAGAGVGIQEARRGESTSYIQQSDGSVIQSRSKDDAEYWKGAVPGALIGAAVCGLVGHYFLDPEPATPPPPPPPPPALPPVSSKRIVLRGVNFDFDKQVIRPDSQPLLNAAIRILEENPNVHITVEGHTDSLGTDAYNEALSIRRAESVFQYLRDGGVDADRMDVVGYGESRPVADNTTPSGRAENRRVELQVQQQDVEAAPVDEAAPAGDAVPVEAEEAVPAAEEAPAAE